MFEDILVESDESLKKANLPNLTTGSNKDGEFGPVPPKGTEVKVSEYNDAIGKLQHSFKEAAYIGNVLENLVPIPDDEFEAKYESNKNNKEDDEEEIEENFDELEDILDFDF